jgi:sialate O-acetylesterase
MRASLLAAAVTSASCAAFQAAASGGAAPPRFHVSNVLGHDCVLQRDRDDTLVWGFGTPGMAVKGDRDGTPLACTAVDAATVWRCTVPRTPAGATLHNFSFTQADGQTATLDRALFGDVFVIGGQSNAVFALTDAFGGKEAIAAATPARYPLVRLFTVGQDAYKRDPALQPELSHWIQNWTAVSPAAVGGASWTYFSAVGWFFGAALNDILAAAEGGVPLGLVNNNWGGTLIQQWTPVGALSPACNQSANPIRPMNVSNGDLYGPAINPYAVGPMQLTGVVWYQGAYCSCGGVHKRGHCSDLGWRDRWLPRSLNVSPACTRSPACPAVRS